MLLLETFLLRIYFSLVNGNPVIPPADPSVPEPSYDRGMDCLQPEGWLKLDQMCFKMFEGNDLTWTEAEASCQKDGGHLVSVSNNSIRAVTQYMSSLVNRPFWIGLRYQKFTNKLLWLNDWPVLLSRWEKNQPSNVLEDTCFASTSEGYWKEANCDEQMPYICQITTGKIPNPEKYTGDCPSSSTLWKPSSGSYCYIFDSKEQKDFFVATLICYRYGSYLASIHSMEQVEFLKEIMESNNVPVLIGLVKNSKGGFQWSDHSPVDFVFWDRGEPDRSFDCVEMAVGTLRWRMTPCSGRKNFICQSKKSTLMIGSPDKQGLIDETSADLSALGVAAIVVCVVVIAALAAVLYYRRFSGNSSRHMWRPFRQESVSFENALYDVDSASLAFQEEKT